ncbi:MAG: hypothetical protein J6B28_05335, partial [Eubacterium sp.]|nr:hypothetical protein [Eubacterium sp.]
MTEEEIDAYYRKREEEHLKRYYDLQAKRVLREDRGKLVSMVAALLLILVVCTIFLKLNFQVQQQIYQLAVLEKEIDMLRLENADAEKRLEDAGNATLVWEKAQAMGMGYPKMGNVIYYTLEESDYMIQIGEIPQ